MSNQQIEQAVASFRALLEEQIERAGHLNDGGARDFTARPLQIGLIGGDGIGPIIVKEAERVLQKLLQPEIDAGQITLKTIEGLTIEHRLEVNQSIPDDVMAEILECPVLLKGPTTTPGGGTMTSANVTMRRKLDLFANVRPVRIPEEGVDWTFFRENTEGEYTLGSRGIEIEGLLTMDFKVTTIEGTRRIAKAAFDFARKAGKHHVTIVTKANIMKKTDGLFSDICHEVAKDYPEMEVDEYYVDIMSANLANPATRSRFEVIVTPNLYGDILTDEAAQMQGGVGTAGSANTGSRYAMFEAIHGSAPRVIEQGRGPWANPESILQASAMLLEHIGCADRAARLRSAMAACRAEGLAATGRPTGLKCAEYADEVMKRL